MVEGGTIKACGKFAKVKEATDAAWAMMADRYMVLDCGATICGAHKGEVEHNLTIGDLEEQIFDRRTTVDGDQVTITGNGEIIETFTMP